MAARQRAAVLAYYLRGLSHREIATLLGTSVGGGEDPGGVATV
jgi:DNA-directed RNA polymerase specialized sigma24 family protein